jgi:hypothetical protein
VVTCHCAYLFELSNLRTIQAHTFRKVIIGMHKNILSIKRAAYALGVTVPTISYHIKKGNLRADKWLDTYVIDADDFNAFVAAKKAGKFNRGRPRKVAQP